MDKRITLNTKQITALKTLLSSIVALDVDDQENAIYEIENNIAMWKTLVEIQTEVQYVIDCGETRAEYKTAYREREANQIDPEKYRLAFNVHRAHAARNAGRIS